MLQQASMGGEARVKPMPTPASQQAAQQPSGIDDFDCAINVHHTWTMSQIQAALKKNPTAPELQTDLARAYSLDGDVDQAMAILNKIITENPRYGRAYWWRAKMYTADGNIQSALPDFHRAIEFGSPDVALSAHETLAHIYLGDKRWQQAQKEFDTVINSGLLSKRYKANLELERSGIALSNNDTARGLSEIAVAIKDWPRLTPAYMRRADIYAQQNKLQQAVADYTTAIEIERDHCYKVISDNICTCYRERARLYARLGRKDLAYRDRVCAQQYERESVGSSPLRSSGN